uniref:Uncharacterized protein n=1 Tax=Rhizophora mucronata TaxID=61149 RepID=A0A2P2QUU8_RHIMU
MHIFLGHRLCCCSQPCNNVLAFIALKLSSMQ